MGEKIKKVIQRLNNKEISIFYLGLSYLRYKFSKKKIILGNKTIIRNLNNIILKSKDSELLLGTGSFGLTTKMDYSLINIHNSGKLIIDGKVSIGRGSRVSIGKDAELYIGNNSNITGLSKLICHKSIYIGSNCLISWNVQIMDTDFHYIIEDEHVKDNTKSIIIGNNVWIASNASIFKGVNIGDNSIIAANSVVINDIPPNSLVAGNPAKVVKTNINWKP